MEEDNKGTALSNVIRIDDDRVKEHLDKVVRGTVEETLNAMLEAEADRLCNAGRYERSEARRDLRSGSYERKLQTKAGSVTLKMPKLRQQAFETAIIERYRRRESSVEEALIEMYLAGVSVRRVEDITEALWGTRVSPGTVSNLNRKIYGQIEAWRSQPIAGEHPYLYLDGIVLKRSWAGEVRNVSLLVAIGVNASGSEVAAPDSTPICAIIPATQAARKDCPNVPAPPTSMIRSAPCAPVISETHPDHSGRSL